MPVFMAADLPFTATMPTQAPGAGKRATFRRIRISVEGQRRWVWLKGCVSKPEQSSAVEQLVRNIDDVESVINQLIVVDK